MRLPWSGNGKGEHRKVLFAVKDQKAGCFPYEVMSAVTRDVAERGFADAVNDPEMLFCKHPEDYSLWKVGEYDPVSGVIYACEHGPQFWVEAVSLVRPSDRTVARMRSEFPTFDPVEVAK